MDWLSPDAPEVDEAAWRAEVESVSTQMPVTWEDWKVDAYDLCDDPPSTASEWALFFSLNPDPNRTYTELIRIDLRYACPWNVDTFDQGLALARSHPSFNG